MIQFHNTLGRRTEPFRPLRPGEVGFYACGPTVYDYFHIGNARSFVAMDVARRALELAGLRVTFVQNLTDIDDRILSRAKRDGIPASEVAETFAKAFFEDLPRLGIRPADHHPRATEHVGEIVALIERLLSSGHAYRTETGVYFEVEKFSGYGKLSGKPLDELRSGARVEVDEKKRAPADFALWKAVKPDEPMWPAPFGDGRPGWHIECSAMSMKLLGESFDIHSGGHDLIFPHHENEIAQSEAATGRPFAHTWLHNAFLNMDSEKMSKSLGNFRTAREVCDAYGGEAVRLFLISGHYRKQLEFSDEALHHAKAQVQRFGIFFDTSESLVRSVEAAPPFPPLGHLGGLADALDSAKARFDEAMSDDLNTPAALAVLHDLVSVGNEVLSRADRSLVAAGVTYVASLLRRLGGEGLGLFFESDPGALSADERLWLNERMLARARKDFASADRWREKLRAAGIAINDNPWGPVVRRIGSVSR